MEIRKRNLTNQWAPSKHYKIRATHLIDNVRIESIDDETGEITISSQFIAVVHYRSKQTYAGRYLHVLRPFEGRYKIVHKRVTLIDCDAPHETIITYL